MLPSEKFVEWHEEASLQLKQYTRKVSIESKINMVFIKFFPPDKRNADLTNKAESIMDLLVDNGFIKDDNWFEVPRICLYFGEVDKKNTRTEIEIIYE